MPALSAHLALDTLRQYEAVYLFLERAAQWATGRALTIEQAIAYALE